MTNLPEKISRKTGRFCQYMCEYSDGRIGSYGEGDPMTRPPIRKGSTIIAVASYDMLGRRHKLWRVTEN